MSKIICDICGTTYPDTADCCPICGCSRDSAMDLLEDSFDIEDLYQDTPDKKGRFSNKKRKEIFDYDEVNPQVDETEVLDEDPSDDEDEYEESPRSNTGVIIVLTALIAILLLAAAFLFFRFILPSMNEDKPEPSTYAQETQETTQETSNFVPCTSIGLLSGGVAELNEPGQYFLLNVAKNPEDTTDKVYYESGDESIVTVSEDGRLTAVAEGQTVVYITCGNVQMKCDVIVNFQKETEPPTEEAVEETEAEEAEETEAPTQSGLKDVTLKLKKTDIMLGVYYEFRLALDCDLEPTEVEWSVEHPHIASVNEEGVVKALKSGTTSVTAKYGDQEVSCMVRCG